MSEVGNELKANPRHFPNTYTLTMKCIYLRTNLVNGKQYVGQTNDFQQREKDWKYLNGRYSSGIIDNARKKYGLDNFKVEILRECETQDELDEWERYYIVKFNSKKPYGYNITDGGGGVNGYHHSEETKKKLSDFGKYLSPTRKEVLQYTMDGKFVKEWCSISECIRNGYSSAVGMCCLGKRKSSNGYMWKFKLSNEIPQKIEPYDFEEVHNNRSIANKNRNIDYSYILLKRGKPILQYDLKGNFIKEWLAANQAAKELGLNQANIQSNLKGRNKQVGGFIFKYKNGDNISQRIEPYKRKEMTEEHRRNLSEAAKNRKKKG